MQRAYHLRELKDRPDELKIDVEYYLAQQVHPVVARLLEPVDGTDAARLADCLGLDPHQYRHRAVAHKSDEQSADAQLDFSHCTPYHFACPHCHERVNIDDILRRLAHGHEYSLAACPHCRFDRLYQYAPILYNSLARQIAHLKKQFYQVILDTAKSLDVQNH